MVGPTQYIVAQQDGPRIIQPQSQNQPIYYT